MADARVEGIYTAEAKGTPMQARDRVDAVAGVGLTGDRYAGGEGTWSKTETGPDRQVTLIEAEALEAVGRDYGLALAPEATRRNLLVRGVALNHLVGETFRVGEARLRGVELCEPCALMEKTGGPGARGALVHRGGLRAEILEGGAIRVGDVVG
jgi:MOSC domain-containing protein YiiM